MRRLAVLLLALAGPLGAQEPARESTPEPTWQQREAAEAARVERVRAVLAASGFRGVYAVAEKGRRLGGGAIGGPVGGGVGGPVGGGVGGPVGGGAPYEAVFPLTSFTGQVLKLMVLQQVEAGRVALDAPVARYLPGSGGGQTVRRMLAGEGGRADARLTALLERVARRPVAELYAERVAGPTGMGALFQAAGGDTRADANWTGGPTPAERAAMTGQLVGTAEDVLAFDAGLLDGRLLGPTLRAELLRAMSAGTRAGCAGPVADQGAPAGRFGVRNVILPGSATAMVLLTAEAGASAIPLAALCESVESA